MKNKKHLTKESNCILRLNPAEISKPEDVIVDFFRSYHLKDLREELWEWLSAGLTNSNEYYNTGSSRSNLICLYEHLGKLAEAVYIYHKIDRQRKKKAVHK